MSTSSISKILLPIKGRTSETEGDAFEEERKIVEDALADFVQIPTKKKAAGLWQKKIKPEVLAQLDPQEIKRQEAIHEVIESESFYLRDLAMTYRLFATPLQSKGIIKPQEYKDIFCNFYEVIAFHANLGKAMRQLRLAAGNVVSIGATMLQTIADLELCYVTYCSNRSKARDFLNLKRKESARLNKFIKQVELDPECRKLELETFLSQPWQRLMHYPLLFQNILKKTPKDNPDLQDLPDLIQRLNQIISGVNFYTESVEFTRTLQELHNCVQASSAKKAAEVDLLNPERKLLMDGTLRSKWGKKLHGYLLDNCLIIIVVGERMALYCEPFFFPYLGLKTFTDQIDITTSAKGDKAAARVKKNQFQLSNKQSSSKYTLTTDSTSEKRRWLDELQAQLLKVSNSWRDNYDPEFQLHEPTEEKPSMDLEIQSRRSSANSHEFHRESEEGVSVSSLETINALLSDPQGLLSYTKTIASCTSAMVYQLNARAFLADNHEKRDNLWLTAKVIADATVEFVKSARNYAQKQSEGERRDAISSVLQTYKGLHSTLNLNVDDLEDVVGSVKFELPDDSSSFHEGDAERQIMKLSKLPENGRCADCGIENPLWVSSHCRVFICELCAQAHKIAYEPRFGDLRIVKNYETEDLVLAEVERLAQTNNERVNRVYLEKIPDGVKVITPESPLEERIAWVKSKYMSKSFQPKEPTSDQVFISVTSAEGGGAPRSTSTTLHHPGNSFSSGSGNLHAGSGTQSGSQRNVSSLRISSSTSNPSITPPASPGHSKNSGTSSLGISLKKVIVKLEDQSHHLNCYLIAELNKNSHKTSTIKKGTEFHWENLDFVYPFEKFASSLTLTLYEKNLFGKDDKLGQGELLLEFLEFVGSDHGLENSLISIFSSDHKKFATCLLELIFSDHRRV